jgi:hypothetical protein
MLDLNFFISIKSFMRKSSYTKRLPLSEQIIKSRYNAEEVKTRLTIGKAYLSPYNTHLHNAYPRNNVSVQELVILNNENLRPWFVSKIFHGVDEKVKPQIYEAMEMMREKTKGKIFGNSPDAEPITMNALITGSRRLTKEDVDYFKEIEALVIFQEKLLEIK